MRYEFHEGRILTWSLEAHVTTHCNLRCEHCCSLSPHLPTWAVEPEVLGQDLRHLAGVLRPQVFKLTGGEPFLHPNLVGVLDAVHASGIAEQVSITTNGFLAQSAPDAVYERLRRMTLSVYASAPLPERSVARITERCERHGVYLTVKRVDRFQKLTPEAPHTDGEAVRDIHARCWLKVRCHLVHRGRFYTCTRPPHLETVYAGAHPEMPTLSEVDGVALDGTELLPRLLDYLEREEPLSSCRWCLGASGPTEPHAQLPASGRTAA